MTSLDRPAAIFVREASRPFDGLKIFGCSNWSIDSSRIYNSVLDMELEEKLWLLAKRHIACASTSSTSTSANVSLRPRIFLFCILLPCAICVMFIYLSMVFCEGGSLKVFFLKTFLVNLKENINSNSFV